jgi:uncharacterized membrane protein YeaQ/YmgE (transglycosylase-associated protein family)
MSSRLRDSAQSLLRSTFIRASPLHLTWFYKENLDMSILAWVVLGLLAGFIGSKIVNKSGEGLLLDLVLGIVGAVVGGWLFNTFGHSGVTGLNLYSLLVAVVGAVVVLVVWHAIKRA